MIAFENGAVKEIKKGVQYQSKSDFQFTARASVKGTAGRNGAWHGGRVTLVVTVFEELGSAKRPG